MKNRIPQILGIGLTIGLVFGLMGALFAAPVSADLMEWGLVNTPSWEDLEILPASDILDYDIGGDGDTIYAILSSLESCNGVGDDVNHQNFALVKSEDGGVTWSDITDNLTSAANLPPGLFTVLTDVAVAPDDEDWVAVAGTFNGLAQVVASRDGGDNFSYTGDMTDPDSARFMLWSYDLAVSPEVDDIHNIAVAGMATPGIPPGAVFRLKAGTWLSASWEDTSDTTDYLGWDNGLGAGNFSLYAVAIAFSTNFDIDDTIVCLTLDNAGPLHPFIQSGIWESSGGSWNDEAGFPTTAQIKSDGDTLAVNMVYPRCLGLALPDDYDGSDPAARTVFLYANAWNMTTALYGGYVFRVDNNSLSPVCGPAGDPVLASIDVHGDADTGKLMIGEYLKWDNSSPPGRYIAASCCEGVRVWHTEELDFCCPQWDGACKDPSGYYMALVRYTPDGEKEYASTSGTVHASLNIFTLPGTPLDESAFSVSRDNAVSFNQLSLIDTDIDYLSDVAVCPDCSTIYLSTISEEWFSATGWGDYPCLGDSENFGFCKCDSVWRSYDDGDTWERVFHGDWSDSKKKQLLLRLPCDAIEDCCDQDPVSPSGTIYLGIAGTKDIYYSRDCGQCWNDPPATKIEIEDFTVESENVVYVIDDSGMFSMSTQYGRRWSDAVDTGLDSGHTITSCCEQGLIVVGGHSYDPVAWSDDGGDSWNLTDDVPDSEDVHVACAPNCENIIYIAVSGDGGIYRTDITDGEWEDMGAYRYGYLGLVVGKSDGTLYASSDYINKVDTDEDIDICDRFVTPDDPDAYYVYSGVARNLTPCETACCGTEDWDYLICGLTVDDEMEFTPGEYFNAEPSALKICGCLSADTNSVLWAIDYDDYDVTDGSDGSLWSYEDCAAKIGPTLTSPADGAVLDCEPCAACDAANFTLKWERPCIACSYDIEIMDEDGNIIVSWVDEDITGSPPSLFVDGTKEVDSEVVDYFLECGNTYTWHVRMADTDCECVHSPWSDTWSFTVAPGTADAIQLLAPEKGAMGVPIANIGFSWTSVRNATSYSFVLSPNANLTGALVSQDQSTTAFNYVGPLDYSKAYYWQVVAWEDGTRLTTSSIGVFNTMAKPVPPTPPVEVTTTPAPVINIPPAEQITPTWIYAIIGIGAALAVVVIVLIVRTRRP